MNGIWNGTKFVSDEAELKRDCLFCGYCGSRLTEILHPSPSFDRRTGKQGAKGSLYWECPKHGIGLDAISGDWVRDSPDENPHDSVYLRQV